VVALSIVEVEYMTSTHAYKEAIWLMMMCSNVRLNQRDIIVQCDSNDSIFLAKNPIFHTKTKDIDIQYYFI